MDKTVEGGESKILVGEDYILEHFGTKGMRWGTRKAKSGTVAKGTSKFAKGSGKLSKGQKVKVGLVAAGAFFVTANLITAKTLNVKVGLIAGAAAAVSGARFTAKHMDGKGETPLSKIKK